MRSYSHKQQTAKNMTAAAADCLMAEKKIETSVSEFYATLRETQGILERLLLHKQPQQPKITNCCLRKKTLNNKKRSSPKKMCMEKNVSVRASKYAVFFMKRARQFKKKTYLCIYLYLSLMSYSPLSISYENTGIG